MPLYEIASDRETEAWLRQIARRSLEQLGFERREDDGPPAILAWLAGLAVIAGSLALATVIGPWALAPLVAGMGLIVAYYVTEARKAGAGDWYVGPDGDDYWVPGDVPADAGGWLSDLFGGLGGGNGGGGNGGGA